MKPWLPVLALVVVAGAGGAAPAAEHTQAITFREPLGNTWPDELVHCDVAVPQDRVAAATFALAGADGQPVPIQVEVLEGKPEAVRRARVWFKITLPKNEAVALALTWNDDGRAAPPPPAAGVTVRREGDRLVLSTGAADVALAAPAGRFERPVPIDKAPPPILAARPAGDGPWYGQWRLEGPARVREVQAHVVAGGPVWAEVRLKYLFEDQGHVYDVTIRAVRGEPWIDVSEKHRLPEGSRATLVLGDRLKPAEVLWMPWFIGTDGDMRAAYDVRRDRLSERARGRQPFATLRPRWTQVRDNAQVCLAVGSGDGNPAVGAMMTHPSAWARPYGEFPAARVLEDGSGMALDFPLGEGQRQWALLAGPVQRFDSKGKLQSLVRRLADIPLDRVLAEWVFEWPRDAARPAPHILATHDRVAAIRADVAGDADTPAAQLVRRVLKGDLAGDRRLAEYLAGRRERLGGPDVGAEMYLGRAYQDSFLSPAAYPRRLAAALRLADLSAFGEPAGGPAAALLGYVATDPDYWPGYAGGWDVGSPATHRDMITLAVYAAAMMPDHPHAKRWMDAALASLREDLRRHISLPDGAGHECPGLQAAALADVLGLLRAAQNAGRADPWAWPEVRASLEFLRNLHTPPDPRLGRRGLAPLGDTAPWQDAAGAMFGVAAAGVRATDPGLSAAWMAMYRHYYGDGGSGDLATDVLLADPSAPAGRLEDADWSSRAYPGFGAVLRSRFGTPHEAFATFKCGGGRGGYHGDELSFHFFGAAMPVALDWNSDAAPRAEQEHMHNRVNLGDDENMDAAGRMLAMKASDVGDVAVGQAASNRLRRMPRFPHEIGPGAAFPRRTLEGETRYRRFLLLVKHADGPLEDYLVIRDELAGTEPATFNLFVLARSVRREGQAFHFDGQLEADAILYMATPAADKASLATWAWPKQDSSSMIPKDFEIGAGRWRTGELQQWLRVTGMPGRPFLAVLYPFRKGAPAPTFQTLADGKGVRVTLDGATEDVFLATDPAGEAGGQAAVHRGGHKTVILGAKAVPPL